MFVSTIAPEAFIMGQFVFFLFAVRGHKYRKSSYILT